METRKMPRKKSSNCSDLTRSINDLHTKFDAHTLDETVKFANMACDLTRIQFAIDNVNANGRKGLNESFQDLYKAVTELRRADSKLFLNRSVRDVLFNKSWIGKAVLLIVLYIVTNTILHAMGIDISLIELFKLAGGA
jgi:hypothetical protein